MDRRRFLRQSGLVAVAASLGSCAPGGSGPQESVAGRQAQRSAADRIGISTVSLRSRFSETSDLNVGSDPGPPDLTLETVAGFAAEELGIHHLELWNLHLEGTSEADCERIRAAVERAGSRIINVQATVTNPSHVDPDVRARAVAEAREWIDRAATLHAPFVRVDTGGGDAPFDPMRTAESFRRMADYCAERDLTLLVENHGGYSQEIDNVVAIIEAVDRPNCLALADYGNTPAVDTTERIAEVQKLFPHLGLVSAKGTGFGDDYEHSDYDVGALVRATEASGYTGYYSIELWPDADSEPPADPVRATLLMKDLILQQIS